jgi:holliday junction DNA helicase RuvA
MIEAIRGRLVAAMEEHVVVEAGGLSYRLECPRGVCEALGQLLVGAGETPEVRLHVHVVIRPEQWLLFGFRDPAQRAVFRALLGIPGIGPKLALGLLSHMSWQEMCAAVGRQDVARFQSVPGIGKRTAARIVVELAGKLEQPPGGEPPSVGRPAGDATDALVALGIARPEATELIAAVQRSSDQELDTSTLIALALKRR